MKKIPNWIIILIVIGLLITIKMVFLGKKDQTAGQNAGKGKASGPVTANYVVAQSFEFNKNVYTTGKVGAINELELKPETSGKVIAIYFKEGESVSKGAPIIKINDAELQAQLQKNKLQIKLAEEKLARLNKLLSINGVSMEEYDIQMNEVETLKADQSFILAQLAKTTITAPFPGTIGLKNISEGAYVSPAQTIATLVQTKPLYVEFSISEKYSSLLAKGQTLKFSQDNNPDKFYAASVYAIEPKIDEVTKTLKARALYDGSETLYPGAFVKVFLDLGKSSNSIMIPTQAVIPILKGQKVFVSRNGIAEEVKIVTGVRTDEKIQVLEGLKIGDTVLTTGLMSVKKESKLKLIK